MEKTPGIKTAPKANEVRSYGRVVKLAMAITLALSGVLGGCSKPDHLDKCLGEDQAEVHKDRMKDKKKTCHERVVDYVDTTDGAKRPTLRKDAEHACISYNEELAVTGGLVDAKQDSARRSEEWSQRKSCKISAKRIKNRIKVLTEGDMKKLTED